MVQQLDALWMGVPVITLPGIEMKTRISLSSIMSAGCPEFVATSDEEYVNIARQIGLKFRKEPELKYHLHCKVKDSKLLDSDDLAKSMVEFFKNAIQTNE